MRPAKFREVGFLVRSMEGAGYGRRVQTHEYPLRDTTFSEDLGAPPKVYSFEAFVDWNDRAALLEATNKAGPGTLVHPLFGSLEVLCSDATERESTQAVGIAFFSLTFVLVGTNVFPLERPQTRRLVGDKVDGGRAAMLASFEERFAAGKVPQWVTGAAAGWVRSFSSAVTRATQTMQGAINLASFARTRDPLRTAAEALVANPSLLGSTVAATVRGLAGLAGNAPLATLRTLRSLASFGNELGEVTPATQSRRLQRERQSAFVALVRTATALEAAPLAAAAPLDSYDAAVELRAQLEELLEPQLEDAGNRGDDALYSALAAVRSEVVRDLKERGAELARIRELTLDATVPALVLAQRLYGDATRAGELVTRNPLIRHPIFVPAGELLEVLTT